ncbi:Cellulose synthase-like protein G2 [Vitis vinifera]|uniref:Cellulose synthase-like protein G2 n=1 Tax=Vitis vinifera TaxID=29760 RepID=A0A438KM00_VITVI|nr:Cellulose synthase-like protein G2 [Vitis vinifera]
MDSSLPLQLCYVRKSTAIINRWYTLIHSTALMALVYYRASFLFQNPENRAHTPASPWLLVFAGELILSFIWLLGQAYRWRPVTRTLFPERLPEDKHLPAIDVFICTADPKREPTFGVMNTVISAMAWIIHREASCDPRNQNQVPRGLFSSAEDDEGADLRGTEFFEERKKIKKEFELFRERVMRATENGGIGDKSINGDRPPIIEVIGAEEAEMPILVYVSREKTYSHPHHFKAGALNVLLRVSSMISNSPYILVLDCDMYCNDPASVRQAMCCHLDPKLSISGFCSIPSEIPQYYSNDIYDSQMRSAFSTLWEGMDGLDGPVLSGTGFYMKRVALYGTSIQGGWTSVFCVPSRPQFVGSSVTNLNDLLVQGTRWSSGLVDVGISNVVFWYHPQLCLFHGVPLYPEVSNSFFGVFPFIFLSACSKHLLEVILPEDQSRHGAMSKGFG